MNQPKIFIVEDENIIAKDIEERLKRLGYSVAGIAASGEKALREIPQAMPDLVLMDIVLKKPMDGIKVAEHIHARHDIPIIYLTAYADNETLQRAKITQPFGYILKPFEEREMHVAIEIALFKHKMEKKLRENEQWLATTLISIADGIIATDPNHTIKFMNAAAEMMTGWNGKDAAGKSLTEVFHVVEKNGNGRKSFSPNSSPNEGAMRAGPMISTAGAAKLISKSGRQTSIDYNTSPIRDAKGIILGIVLLIRDMTERALLDEALRKSHEDLESKVEERTQELARVNEELKKEIRERKSVEVQLRNRELSLSRSNTELEQFAFTVSHDLQEPVSLVLGYADLLKNGIKGKLPTELGQYIETIKEESKKMQVFIRDLLEYSRVDRAQEISASVQSLEILKQVLLSMDPSIKENKVEITYDTLPDVQYTKTHLMQVFQNIISNAIKFRSQKAPRIHIKALEKEEEWIFSISDNGIGIAPENIDKTFAMFERAHGEDYPGNGIGLAICKKIAERHSGKIWVESRENQGSTFYFTIRKAEKEGKNDLTN